jgi:hypothetical protein
MFTATNNILADVTDGAVEGDGNIDGAIRPYGVTRHAERMDMCQCRKNTEYGRGIINWPCMKKLKTDPDIQYYMGPRC